MFAEVRGLFPGARILGPAALAVALGGCNGADGGESPLARGDRAFAEGDYEDALAEYRLSMREDAGMEALLRAAHTQVVLGRVDEARELYDRAVREDSAHADQAASDFVARARRAFADRDSYGGASAIEAALHFRPGIVAPELVLPMARHYSGSGRHGRAQPLYLRVLGTRSGDPEVVFEAALAHMEIGECGRTMQLLEEFNELAPRREPETRWHVGSCAYRLARELIDQGAVEAAIPPPEDSLATVAEEAEPVDAAATDAPPVRDDEAGTGEDEAAGGAELVAEPDSAGGGEEGEEVDVVQQVLGYLDLVLELGEPRTVLPDAYFQRAEILARLGDCAGAIESYNMVPRADVSGSGALIRDARARIDQIRFGEGDGPC